jgi:hypothetical protein
MLNLCIVGCGSLGSNLINEIVEYNNIKRFYDEINIVDNDVIEGHNFPYLNIIDKKYINTPKVFLLRRILKMKIIDENVNYFYSSYKNVSFCNKDMIYIDCRDVCYEDSLFKFKMCYDNSLFRIIFNPVEQFNKYYQLSRHSYLKESSYIISSKNFLSRIIKFSKYIILKYIFNKKYIYYNGERKERIINV